MLILSGQAFQEFVTRGVSQVVAAGGEGVQIEEFLFA